MSESSQRWKITEYISLKVLLGSDTFQLTKRTITKKYHVFVVLVVYISLSPTMARYLHDQGHWTEVTISSVFFFFFLVQSGTLWP